MAIICILLGFFILVGSILLGIAGANVYLNSAIAQTFVTLSANTTQTYILFDGVCGFIGLLICLNLVMLGLTYNKDCKLSHRKSIKK